MQKFVPSRLLKNRFVILLSGPLLVKIVSLLSMTLITRLYGADEIGIAAEFLAFSMLFLAISTLNYPLAITITKSKTDIIRLTLVSITICALLCVAILLFLLLTVKMEFYGYYGWFLLILPFAILARSIFELSTYTNLRLNRIVLSAKSTTVSGLTAIFTKILAGLILPKAFFLISSGILNEILFSIFTLKHNYTVLLFRQFKKSILKGTKRKRIIAMIKSLKSYPLQRTPQALIFALNESVPIIYIVNKYGTTAAGIYSLARTTLELPSSLIGSAVSQYVMSSYYNFSNIKMLFSRCKFIVVFLIMGCATSWVLLNFFGEKFYSILFGEEFAKSGVISSILIIGVTGVLISKPLISLVPLLKLEKQFLFFELISFTMKLMVVLASIFFVFDLYDFIFSVSLTVVLSYFVFNAYLVNKMKSVS